MYYIPKKSRCKTGCSSLFSNTYLCFATKSSMYTSNIASRNVYNTDNNEENKNKGNTIKRGSGGNSYSDYLMRKKGNIFCNCNLNCINKHNKEICDNC